MRFHRFDVVKVPFPFTDRPVHKFRPALVVSDHEEFGGPVGHSVMAMITSARHSRWPLDVIIEDLSAAGLPAPSLVRMKLFTLDHRLIQSALGSIGARDRRAVSSALARLLNLPGGPGLDVPP
ncbi:MAG: type II toxin-antitoxin system PemK/MazF family toxin [Wenzhouxiangellaceae bacterium]